MNESLKEKLRSWPMWASLIGLIVFCVKQFAGVDIGPVVDELVAYLLPVLIAFGIINNPNDRTKV